MANDLSVGGDMLAHQNLLPPEPEAPETVADYAALADRLAARYQHAMRMYDMPVLIETSANHAAWLVSWEPGQRRDAETRRVCRLVAVLDGTLTERTPTGVRPVHRHTQRFHPPGCWPELVNDTTRPATAVLIYFRS
jgi:hypothetical protein